jgi:tetratricopeptide (TPR) repeat protein
VTQPLYRVAAFGMLAFLLAVVPSRVWAQAPAAGEAPAATLQAIAGLLQRGDLAGAQAAADRALRAHAGDPALHNLAGVIHAQQGSFTEAEAHFQRAIALESQFAAAYENLGRLYQVHSAVDTAARQRALETYAGLLALVPGHRDALFQSALLLALEGRFADSMRMLEQLPPDLRERPQVQAVTVTALAGSGEPQRALSAATELAGHAGLTAEDVLAVAPAFDHLRDTIPAVRLLEALDRRGLGTPGVLHRLGSLYIRIDRPDDALAVLERAADGRASVPLLTDLARAASKAGQHERALGYLGHARALEPDNPHVHFLFAIVCVQLDLVAEAHESLSKAVALAPDNPAVNYAMGAVSMHRRDQSEAVPYFEKYVELVPDDPRGRFALGAARFHANDLEGARRELQQVADRPETTAGANYYLARAARQSNDLAEARRAIAAALRANPKYADAWAELGLQQTRAGEFEQAEQSLRTALAIAPENYQATVHLTALYTRTRDPRLEEQQGALAALQQKREQHAQELLRMVEVVPQ